MNPASLKIIFLDNQPLYQLGMVALLKREPCVQSVLPCSSFTDLQLMLKENEPHLIFLELNLGSTRHDGFSVCREIKQQYKNVFVAMLSHYNAPHFIRFAQECGAGAFFDKHSGPDLLSQFLHSFCKGSLTGYYVRVSPYGTHQTNVLFKDDFEMRYLLTRQECRVMKMIVAAKEHHEIEDELGISYDTFRTHHNHILDKLQVKNDVELTKFAIQFQLLEMDCNQLPSNTVQGRITKNKPSNI